MIGGTFRLGFAGYTTASIDYDATSSELGEALTDLPSIDSVDVSGKTGKQNICIGVTSIPSQLSHRYGHLCYGCLLFLQVVFGGVVTADFEFQTRNLQSYASQRYEYYRKPNLGRYTTQLRHQKPDVSYPFSKNN